MLRMIFAEGSFLAAPADAQDMGWYVNLERDRYSAISYMKEIASKFDLAVDVCQAAEADDIHLKMAVDQIGIGASAAGTAVAARGNDAKLLDVARVKVKCGLGKWLNSSKAESERLRLDLLNRVKTGLKAN